MKKLLEMLPQNVRQILKHPLISGSIVIFIGTLLANALNFVFHLFMIKNLSKVDYGTLQTLMSLVTIPSVAAGAIVPLIVNFGAVFFAKNELGKIRGLYSQLGKTFFLLGLVIFILFLFITPRLAQFFHIDNYFLFFLTDFIILLSFIGVINLALLQAKLAFNYSTFITFLSSALKLLLGAAFVIAGYSVAGAIGALALSSLLPYFLTFIPLSFLFSKKIKMIKINTKNLVSYGIPSALTFIGMNSLIATDLLLVKHFFPSSLAGEYAGLSLIGKVIFFFTAPITTVMFPLIVQKHSKNQDITKTFSLAIFLIFTASILLTLVYFLAPQMIIHLFANKEYLDLSQYLGYYALFITFYSLANLFIIFYLAINKTKIFIPVLFCAILQAVLIWFFHQTIFTIIQISIGVALLLLIILLLYYPSSSVKKPR